jgi:hypothetical protein
MNRFHHSSISTTSLLQKSIPEIYCSCDISIIPTTVTSSATDIDESFDYDTPEASSIIKETRKSLSVLPSSSSSSSNDGNSNNNQDEDIVQTTYQTTAYFRDTKSKRAKIVLPILLKFENEFDRKAVIRSGAIQPLPTEAAHTKIQQSLSSSNDGDENNSSSNNDPTSTSKSSTSYPDASATAAAATTRCSSSGWDSLGDGADLWSSELDTLGEARGESQDGTNSEKLELNFECLCIDNVVSESNSNSVNAKNKNKSTNDKNKNNGKNDDNVNSNGSGTMIESVKVLSTSLIDTNHIVGIRFNVEVSVRSFQQQQQQSNIKSSSSQENKEEKKEEDNNKTSTVLSTTSNNNKLTRLQIKAVLVCTSSTPADDEENFFESKKPYPSLHNTTDDNNTNGMEDIYGENFVDSIFLAKQALDMGVNHISPYDDDMQNLPASSYFARTLSYILPPKNHNIHDHDNGLCLDLNLVPALKINIREVSGASSDTGITLISLVICHSNLHNEDVTITNIALHPGHSRLFNTKNGNGGRSSSHSSVLSETAMSIVGPGKTLPPPSSCLDVNDNGMTMPAGEDSVMNMIKHVRWGYVQGTAPSLPLTLKPQEAFATVIQINASESIDARTFVSPICVHGVVGENSSFITNSSTHSGVSGSGSTVSSNSGVEKGVVDTYRDEDGNNTSMIMVSADAMWTTAQVVTGKADAYHVGLSVEETQCNVGEQIVVSLKVRNLSDEPRNLTLMMAKEENPSEEEGEETQRNNAMNYAGGNLRDGEASAVSSRSSGFAPVGVNNAVVYEVNGYTFGVWGLSGDDDGTVRYSRDHELLAVDAALLLGEVKGQHSIDAELRFVPLREGILKVPNLRLYDNYTQTWFDCIHTLKIIGKEEIRK